AALAGGDEAGDVSMAARCSLDLASAYLALDRPAEALEAARDSLARCRTAATPAGVALAQRCLGEALAALGRYDEALGEFRAALDLCGEGGLGPPHPHPL